MITKILFFILSTFLLIFFAVKPTPTFAACGASCGWTGTQCGVSQCVQYENPGQCGWGADGQCWCLIEYDCQASGCWPASCEPQGGSQGGRSFSQISPGCCSTGPTPTPTPLCDGWAQPNSCHQNTGNGCYYRCNSSGTGWDGPYGSGCSGSCGTTDPSPPPPSPPPPPITGVIQGRKGYVTLGCGFNQSEPAISQAVTMDGSQTNSSNPYGFSFPLNAGETHSVTAPNLSGYERGATLCYNDIGCHNPACPAPTSSVTVSNDTILSTKGPEDPFYYADLYWHYTPLPTCTISANSPVSPGDPVTITATATVPRPNTNVTVDADVAIQYNTSATSVGWTQIAYSNCNNQNATCALTVNWTPPTCATYPCNYYVSCRGWNDGLHECSPYYNSETSLHPHPRDADCGSTDAQIVTVRQPGAWWQVRGGDVLSLGNLVSPIPPTCTGSCIPNFNLAGLNTTFPGVNIYNGTGKFTSGTGTGVSGQNFDWKVNAQTYSRTYDYDYFWSQVPADVYPNIVQIPGGSSYTQGTFVSSSASRGFEWFRVNGDFHMSSHLNISGSRKVILFVDGGNLNIWGDVTIQNPGQGFFMAIVGKRSNGLRGDIVIRADAANDLHGIYIAEGTLSTGTYPSQFNGRGAFVAYDGFNLGRDRGSNNATSPAEFFEYAPEQMMLFPNFFGNKRLIWSEVAP